MKKNILVAILTSLVLILSSCVIYADDVIEEHFHYYDFTFYNDTDKRIADWYLRTESGEKIAKSSNFVNVYPRSKSTLHNVREDSYRVMLAYSSDPYQYYYSDEFYLNKDMIYYLYTAVIYHRSATGTENIEEKHLYIVDETGNKIQLHPASQNE